MGWHGAESKVYPHVMWTVLKTDRMSKVFCGGQAASLARQDGWDLVQGSRFKVKLWDDVQRRDHHPREGSGQLHLTITNVYRGIED